MFLGSHVSGIVAGSCLDADKQQMKDYNGMASGAKLAFFDIGATDETLYVPEDLAEIFKTTHRAGGFIHSNSWGGSYWYDTFSVETDNFLYDYDDFVLVFAAGNDGKET